MSFRVTSGQTWRNCPHGVTCPWNNTVRKQAPGALYVAELWEFVEQLLFFQESFCRVRFHERLRAEGRTEYYQAVPFRR